jgi:hypothetical protein
MRLNKAVLCRNRVKTQRIVWRRQSVYGAARVRRKYGGVNGTPRFAGSCFNSKRSMDICSTDDGVSNLHQGKKRVAGV